MAANNNRRKGRGSGGKGAIRAAPQARSPGVSSPPRARQNAPPNNMTRDVPIIPIVATIVALSFVFGLIVVPNQSFLSKDCELCNHTSCVL